jgi:hypothetical protein
MSKERGPILDPIEISKVMSELVTLGVRQILYLTNCLLKKVSVSNTLF